MTLDELKSIDLTEGEFNYRCHLLAFAIKASTIKFSTTVMTPERLAKFKAIKNLRSGDVDLNTLDVETAQMIKVLSFALTTLEPAPEVVN